MFDNCYGLEMSNDQKAVAFSVMNRWTLKTQMHHIIHSDLKDNTFVSL